MSSIFGKSALSPEWAERFREIVKLNAYAQSTPVRLSNVVIEGYNLSGAKLSGAEFEKVEWKKVTLKSGEFTNTKFIHSSFEEVVFENVLFKDTVFEDAIFDASTFFHAELLNVRFVRCQFKNAGLESLKASTISIEDSKLEDVSFFRSVIIATVRWSKFIDVGMTGLVAPSALTFEKSDLKEVNADDSILSSLRATDSQIDATFKNAKIGRVEFEGSELDTSLSESVITSMIVASSKIKTLRMNSAKMDSVVIRDCEQTKNFGFYKATVRKIDVERSKLSDFDVAKTSVETLRISNSTLSETDFEELKAKSVSLENIFLDGKVDFTNAHIDQLTTKNITKLPSLNLITTGSNVKFD